MPSARGVKVWVSGLRAIALALLLVASAAWSADAAAAAPSIVTGKATATTTGAVVQLTINPHGTDTYYEVLYGPSGGALSSKTGYFDAGAGTSDLTKTVELHGLRPSTGYTYEAEAYQNATYKSTYGAKAAFTTPPQPTGPGTPILPPKNPSENGIFSGACDTDTECVSDSNGVRAMQEGLPPFALPSNWSALTAAERIFVATNIERTSRGEATIPNLVTTYDSSVQAGVQTDSDPDLSNMPGNAESVWAGGNPTVMGAIYGWLYQDGPGSTNLDCTPSDPSGCWGHRDALLDNPATGFGNATEMDAAAGQDANGDPSYAATFVVNDHPTDIAFTWAQEQPFLEASPPAPGPPPPAPGPPPPATPPSDKALAAKPLSFKAVFGRGIPSLVALTRPVRGGTTISYQASQASTTTFTIARCVARTPNRHGGACAATKKVGKFTHHDAVGTNRVRFTGRVNGQPLAPGSYMLTVVPTAGGLTGKALRLKIKIAR